jgi:hypothetical protein
LNLAWLRLEAGDVVPDYGGRNETFQVALITPPAFLRLRMAPVRRKLLARTAGELIDLLTIAGMAAGLAERLRGHDDAT